MRRKCSGLRKNGGIPEAQQIAEAIGAYNKADAADAKPQQRFPMLRQLDQAIYGWYGKLKVQALAGEPDSALVGQVVTQSEAEFRALVAANKDKMTPLDTSGLDAKDLALVDKLWQSISGGKGRIRLAGSDEFKERTLANIAKILQTPTGVKLLAYLDQPGKKAQQDPRKQVIVSNIVPPELATDVTVAPTFSFAKETGRAEARSIKKLPKAPWFSWKYLEVKGKLQPDAVEPSVLQQAIFGGYNGIRLGEDYYEFDKGAEGAFVTSVAPKDTEQDVQGTGGDVAYTPEFVTLAHELGHAMHMLAGAVTGNEMDLMKAAGGDKQVATDKWSNPEELFNIIGVDNPIRAQAGLPARGAHQIVAGPLRIVREKRKAVLGTLTHAMAEGGGAKWYNDPTLEAFQGRIDAARKGKTLEDDLAFNQLMADWAELRKSWIGPKDARIPSPAPPKFEGEVFDPLEATSSAAAVAGTGSSSSSSTSSDSGDPSSSSGSPSSSVPGGSGDSGGGGGKGKGGSSSSASSRPRTTIDDS